MKEKFKKRILIDLDGVLNIYTGNYQKDYIPPIREGAKGFLENLNKDFEIKLFTTREKTLVYKWLIENDLETMVVDVVNTKEPAWLIIDDRCMTFEGSYSEIFDKIHKFKAWYKK